MPPPGRIGGSEEVAALSSQATAGEVRRRVLELAVGKVRRKVLGLGFWVQAFRCFPWTGVNFYLKDGLKVAPYTLQMIHNSANLPMVGKPLYGFLSDFVNLCGQHRIPYIAIGGAFSLFLTHAHSKNLVIMLSVPHHDPCELPPRWSVRFF